MVLGAQSGGVLLRGGKRLSKLLERAYHNSRGPFAAEPEPVPLCKLKDSFNDATSVTYLEELEKRYLDDPGSIDRTWASFFKSLGRRRRAAAAAAARSPGSCVTRDPRRSHRPSAARRRRPPPPPSARRRAHDARPTTPSAGAPLPLRRAPTQSLACPERR